MKKFILALVLFAFFCSPVFVFAQEATPITQEQATQQLIISLQKAIELLKQQINDLLKQYASIRAQQNYLENTYNQSPVIDPITNTPPTNPVAPSVVVSVPIRNNSIVPFCGNVDYGRCTLTGGGITNKESIPNCPAGPTENFCKNEDGSVVFVKHFSTVLPSCTLCPSTK